MKKQIVMHKKEKVLVVGTTSDYIDWIQKACPGRALFLTDPGVRESAIEPRPDAGDEILVSPGHVGNVKKMIKKHLEQWHQVITGVACFDCESLETASFLAAEWGVDYPDIRSIRNCRNKYISKTIWYENNIRCPQTRPVNSFEEAVRFFFENENGIVLKPFYGSGSELVFRCRTTGDCVSAFQTIKDGLRERSKNPLFKQNSSCSHLMLAEKFVVGPEYSCDFIIEEKKVRIIRMTRKIKPSNQPFGTVSGYILTASLPHGSDPGELESILCRGALALGIKRGLCMVDFVFSDHSPVLIEMTPRPGGDCLPFLLKEAGNIDILSLALDFAEKKPMPINGHIPFKPLIGHRIHARKSGIFKGYNTDLMADEKRIKKVHFIRKPGHKITLPPRDYDSWLLGHMIIEPDAGSYPQTQCILIEKRLCVEIE